GVRLPGPPAQGAAGSPAGIAPTGVAPASPASPASGAERTADAEARSRIEFHAYVAAEVSGILSTVEAALHRLELVPRDREPLKSILRRQRALLGSARLESLTEIAETLRSIDQVCRLIARRDVPVQG